MLYQPLTREELINVIEGKSKACRIPVLLHIWTGAYAFAPELHPRVIKLLTDYPCDAQVIGIPMPEHFNAPEDDPAYRWLYYDNPVPEVCAIDESVYIPDWDCIDEIIANAPSSDYAGLLKNDQPPDGRYRIAHWWGFLYEKHWGFRGMTNALTDYYEYPDEVHKLFRAMTDFYKGAFTRFASAGIDGIFTSDDLGTQCNSFFSPDIFREFFFPYYKELIDHAHSLGMHFWLHTCGHILNLLPQLIEAGVDVVHPIQKHTMDEKEVAQKFGDEICIFAGFDVQQAIPYGTVEDVKNEVRFLYNTYFRPDGRLMFTAGNGITGDCPIDSLEMLFKESFDYGMEICK